MRYLTAWDNRRGMLVVCIACMILLAGCDDRRATAQAAGPKLSDPGRRTDPAAGNGADTDATGAGEVSSQTLSIPDVVLVNQEGEPVHFYEDLVKDKVVAIDFVFTTCKGICPALGAAYASLRRALDKSGGGEVSLISISIDPAIDTPERLKAWSGQFGAGHGWTLLTGEKQRVDQLLKALQVFTADKNSHSPLILIGDASAGQWRRVNGLAEPQKLAEMLVDLQRARNSRNRTQTKPVSAAEPNDICPAQRYFTDVLLINQDNKPMRLYSDLLKGRVVVVNSFFSSCQGACPVMMGTFARLQERFGDRLGTNLYLISVSVDPETDTPERLSDYAHRLKAKPGWYFMTGSKENVEIALQKLGQATPMKEGHSNIFIIGNESTGLWKKAFGLSPPDEIIRLVEEVLNDRG
jgi:protein SCO1